MRAETVRLGALARTHQRWLRVHPQGVTQRMTMGEQDKHKSMLWGKHIRGPWAGSVVVDEIVGDRLTRTITHPSGAIMRLHKST